MARAAGPNGKTEDMSTTPASDTAAIAKLKPMQALMRGRVEESRRHGAVTYTRVITPAADAYSRPQLLEIRSKNRLGQKGEEITCVVQLGGFTRKAFRATDKETGETSMVTPVDHTVDAVED